MPRDSSLPFRFARPSTSTSSQVNLPSLSPLPLQPSNTTSNRSKSLQNVYQRGLTEYRVLPKHDGSSSSLLFDALHYRQDSEHRAPSEFRSRVPSNRHLAMASFFGGGRTQPVHMHVKESSGGGKRRIRVKTRVYRRGGARKYTSTTSIISLFSFATLS